MPASSWVGTYPGVPPPLQFSITGGEGTPIVINTLTDVAYYWDGTAVTQLGFATVEDLSGYAKLAGGNNFTGSQGVAFQALTDAANIATDALLSNHFNVTLGGNRTLDNPTNLKNGGIYNWHVKQDGTGSRTLAYGSLFKWPGGTAPVLTTAINALDVISCHYNNVLGILVCSVVKDIK